MTDSALMAISETLGQLSGLQSMIDGERYALAGHFEPQSIKSGRVICREGEDADALFILAHGVVEIVKKSGSGRDFVVAQMKPVNLFGHVGLVTSAGRRTATVRATGPVQVLRMNKLRMQLLLRSTDFEVVSPFRRALIVALSRQLQAANQSLVSLAKRAGQTEQLDPDSIEGGRLPTDAELELLKAQSQV